jgi:V8-like Glu-specific endopeptidase
MRCVRSSGLVSFGFLLLATVAGCSQLSQEDAPLKRAAELVYGSDDRIESADIQDPRVRAVAEATAALVLADDVTCVDGSCQLRTRALADQVGPICDGELLKNQRAGAVCTAFLIAPDLMVTAGHCLDDCSIGNFPPKAAAIVFGFDAGSLSNGVSSVPADNVYQCAEMERRAFTGTRERDQDFAVFRLNRPVVGRVPVSTLTPGSLQAAGAEIAVVGHPLGTPLKAALNGKVVVSDASAPRVFSNLDHLPGNSGSPVIDLATGSVSGILVTTPSLPNFVPSHDQSGNSCAVESRCDEQQGCGNGLAEEDWAGIQRIGSALSCFDGIRDGLESALDCGGPECAGCATGATCNQASDCASQRCESGVCAPAFCEDGVRDNGELDVDCGNGCGSCAIGQHCEQSFDCETNNCTNSVCQAPSCSDSSFNGDESDIDCGGSCKPCRNGSFCFSGSDCGSGMCNDFATCVDDSCPNGVQDGTETGVDCGGTCFPCADGEVCRVNADCSTGICGAGHCLAYSCGDGVKDEGETDIDCGGPCAPCARGALCSVDADCSSDDCRAGRCSTTVQCPPKHAPKPRHWPKPKRRPLPWH